ncbi:glycosyltransferase [Limnoraphis robusta Tam1]|uniref:Glycosyltransferase n=1 Tax=Limnoraphis robusta CCNP1315 TaxID=3110306 RepID=A0ABU5U602_9CYAN|nr:glycosyltransferase [Limnoraphis robusta]MEA5498864.1 glycosyltransferase [Limnoraphis robusta BA-68 BA1]MEA5522609.1 glycosyltransferase [Limnoraphis robusta CCNP1315]MEA5541925.1 glycosyltransferase [Limnoraphis robusta Tam1]MEA5546520.1 glycosyltransferase [Limnoraphis robusta CCNP1324]
MKPKTTAGKLKISILSPTLSKGGLDRAYILGQALQTLNYDVAILGCLFTERIYPLPPPNLPVDSVPGGIYPQLFISAQQLLNKIDGDIVLAVKPKPTSFGVALLKKVLTRKPVILDIDDWELSWCGGENWRYRPPSLKQFYRDVFKKDGQLRQSDHPIYLQWMERLVSRADAITVDTEFLKKRFGGVYLPNGKDTEMFNPQQYDPEISRERYGLRGYRVLMFPGAPRPHKGVEDVLMALDLLNEPDLRLVIVGGSPYDDYDQQLMEKWGEWMIKLPPCPVEKMPEVVAAAHVVVVPQRDTVTAQAQFPLKLTDGMAMAKPVLSTCVGDIPEILGDTGYVVKPNSPQQLAESIRQIFSNWEDAQIKGSQARQKCVENYSLEAMAVILSKVIAGLSV